MRISAQPDKKTTAEAEALGRSRGGFTTKVHAAVDALGNPLWFILTPGQRADITQAEALVAGFEPEAVVGDKGFDSDAFVAQIEAMEAEAVIPSRRNWTKPREIDENLYADRNKIERFFQSHKALPAHRNALREDGPELSGLLTRGLHRDAAALIVNTT